MVINCTKKICTIYKKIVFNNFKLIYAYIHSLSEEGIHFKIVTKLQANANELWQIFKQPSI